MDDLQSLKIAIEQLKKENESLKAAAVHSQERDDYSESQIRFRTVFECSRLGNKIINSDLVILQVNPATVALLGCGSKEEIVGTKIMDYTPEEFQDDWKVLQTNLWDKNTPSFSLETCLRKKDGSVIECQITSILFQDKGETLGYTIIEDITEQNKLRSQKEDFISVASHELKTPITSIKASLQLVTRMLDKELIMTEKVGKLIRSTEVNAVKLGNLVVNLLDATKINQGQLSLNITKFKLAALIENCCTHVRLEEEHRIIQSGDLSLEVCADQEKIDQVVVNLVNNAVKYAPKSKEITIHIQALENEAKVSVLDKGPGIPPENLSKLFNRYFRVNKSGSSSSGLGLGLYISAEIVKRHGGQIGVESEPGKGSTFWFSIPL